MGCTLRWLGTAKSSASCMADWQADKYINRGFFASPAINAAMA